MLIAPIISLGTGACCCCRMGGAAPAAKGATAADGGSDAGIFLRRPRMSHQNATEATSAMVSTPTIVMMAMSFINGGGINGGCGGGKGAGGGGG